MIFSKLTREQRISAVDKILDGALANPLVDNEKIILLFQVLSSEIELYKALGSLSYREELVFLADMDSKMLIFFDSFVNPEKTVTVKDSIEWTLV